MPYVSGDQYMAASGSGYGHGGGGCYCGKNDQQGLGDLGLLAAAAAAFFLLYQAITMMARRKRSNLEPSGFSFIEDVLWQGRLRDFDRVGWFFFRNSHEDDS